MTPTLTPQQFVDKWRNVELKERSAYQQHFLDICRLVDHPAPADCDPSGTFFTFEAGASKTSGGEGFADVWYKNHFGWEYKGKHANLDKAYQQLLQYREALQNPPLLIVSDLDRIILHTNFTNTIKQVYTLALEDLLKPEKLALLRNAFKAPETLKAPRTTEDVTRQAATQFSRLAHILRSYGENPERVAHFLIQLLFCLFAEDVDLLPNRVFTHLLERSRSRSQAFAAQLRQLFAAMSTGGWFGSEEILHFDGRLFEGDFVLELDSEGLAIVAEVAALDWGSIEPSIFGTLFERGLDPATRAQLGAHFTSKEDILLIVEPVLMAPLRRRWAEVQAQALKLAARRDQAKGKQRAQIESELSALLIGFAGEIARLKILDPACGSGNFLYVAIRQLLDLWKEVSVFAAGVGLPRFMPLIVPTPSPEQLHGIETNEYAHQLAQATIWIGYIQWFRENGYDFRREPILRPLDNILKMDAILAYDEQGQPVEPEWPQADVIIGNPPFLGDKKMRTEMGDQYVKDLRDLYSDRLPGGIDLVCYWFEKARILVVQGKAKRVGLLATNSIRNGANRRVLEMIKQSGDIFWAVSDHEWLLDGAAVNVSMVGFDNGAEHKRCLDGKMVIQINADLSARVDITQAKPLSENAALCFLGMMKAGPFDIDGDLARQMLSAPPNPNGRLNSDVIKRRMSGQDVTSRPRDIWVIDFGVDMTEQDAAFYELPFEYVQTYVRPIRNANRRDRLRIKWWLFGETRSGLRQALYGLDRCIITPEVAKHRIFVWMNTSISPSHELHIIARADDYFFGILHSHPHEIWSLRIGSTLEDRPRYSSSRTFEAFPFPWPPGHELQDDPRVQAIALTARELVQYRDNWLNPAGASQAELKKRTLTNLYNQRPTWLQNAHRKLDQAVFAAYGWSEGLSDEQILERLLVLNLERAGEAGKGKK